MYFKRAAMILDEKVLKNKKSEISDSRLLKTF